MKIDVVQLGYGRYAVRRIGFLYRQYVHTISSNPWIYCGELKWASIGPVDIYENCSTTLEKATEMCCNLRKDIKYYNTNKRAKFTETVIPIECPCEDAP